MATEHLISSALRPMMSLDEIEYGRPPRNEREAMDRIRMLEYRNRELADMVKNGLHTHSPVMYSPPTVSSVTINPKAKVLLK
jgi:hypothetical protein